MKQARWMLMVLAALLLSIGIASAELNYILPDSNSRELTWDEVARWDYETLGYAFNEIFARHGYVFHPGESTTITSPASRGIRPTVIPTISAPFIPTLTRQNGQTTS